MAEEIKWFTEAKLNIAKNCIDRHLNKRGDKTAIIFEPNDPSEEAFL
jgi:acetyl-CoA synthetase